MFYHITDIKFFIYDFTGAVTKISYLSSEGLSESDTDEEPKTKESLIQEMENYIKNHKSDRRGSRPKTDARLELSEAFKKIYWAYESYQIDLNTTMSLLKDYCSIINKTTFYRTALDFERKREYADELLYYAQYCPEILNLPKRCGGVPEDYHSIKEKYAEIEKEEENQKYIEREKIQLAMNELNIMSLPVVFYRWELCANGTAKPRTPKPINFEISKFKNSYRKVE